MNKSDTNTILLLLGSIVTIITLSNLFEKKQNKTFLNKSEEDGFKTDRKNFEKDFSNIASDLKKAEKKLLNVI
ncbi:hypothetical protein [Tenacibaculum finnmarkense]|uniref:hypothetical protein n=1 Tax=Tenacibaculum finnmarkense TaxID=2781243 RepID=UPI00187B6615|nr:hypothetical protein [Tenacibaculum finnmarkense]MBE7689063.1 hypothetical protein [Tenacibaculum finnmarkense genomovar ulcerans]MCD8423646.1 hypothetical protein [Tenacibaculum finnmarkense genomovar ulcerans]MCG8236885.1 hypothetical protein [Tenacibaculum finnmarkense genomovar ulcerans]MCG8239828.1 hypothetical protein [Tenacibaculum finnmarkense genomovar ulcerans]MCG8831393.1 hypothetical protein [Tenacibaculum finnmarkense]